jgi:hypothetical protein
MEQKMSGDHNMNQTSPGWRKRQIALDKKAENARELGRHSSKGKHMKTVIEMAREAGFNVEQGFLLRITGIDEDLERFAELVRADEREQIAQIIEDAPPLVKFAQNDQGGCMMCGFTPKLAAKTIRARGQA